MGNVTLDRETHDRISLLAHAWRISEGETVARLVDRFAHNGRTKSETPGEEVPIYVVYKTERVEATFDPKTEAVTIQRGPRAGERFSSPSGAATAVVHEIDPSVTANRNGWGFWKVEDTGELLQSIRRH